MTHIAIQESVNGENVDWLEKVSDALERFKVPPSVDVGLTTHVKIRRLLVLNDLESAVMNYRHIFPRSRFRPAY